MNLDWSAINFLAVATSALATFFLGALWYTALFGKQWRSLHGYTEERLRAMQAKRPPAIFFSVLLVCYFIIALVLAIFVTIFRIDTAMTGAVLGFVFWLGSTAIQMTGHIASDKPMGALLIDVGYQFIYLLMMGAILGGWQNPS